MNDRELMHLLRGVERRAEHLRKYAVMCQRAGGAAYSPLIMGTFAWNIVRTLLLLVGRPLQDEFFRWLVRSFRDQAGLCEICGTPKMNPAAAACQDCLLQFDADDREAEIALQMERDTGGKPQ